MGFLLKMLFPGIEGESDESNLPDDSDVSDSGVDDIDDLSELDSPDDPPVAVSARRSNSDERLAKLEAEVERRAKLADEAIRQRQTPAVDTEFEREEERLRNPETSDIERWQIQANRTLRDTQRQAQQAMFQAQDMADRTRFEAKINSDPRRAKYTDRVEEEIKTARSRGQQASREDVYYWMLGKDIADGKLKPKAKTPSVANVPRGKSPSVRSDVQGRGRQSSDKDKLRARLEGMNI